jgi:hypothetical protein
MEKKPIIDKVYHVLNGDCLAEQLKETALNQDFIICRECLIDGALKADNLAEFWKVRAEFIANGYQVSTQEYYLKTVSEFEKLENLPDNSEVCLWFENDLFCQANMWFVLSFLSNKPTLKLFRIFPVLENNVENWKGFGNNDANDLEKAYSEKVFFEPKDIELGQKLWAAFQNSDFIKLKELSKQKSACFAYLEEVCQAHIDRFPVDETLGRPEKVVKEIIETMSSDFQEVFKAFSAKEGIYGFGDLQLKTIYDRQMKSISSYSKLVID